MPAVVTTIKDRCKRCYTCIRNCPAKAIKVEDGQAKVLEERCIACGNCYKICAQGAKQIHSSVDAVAQMLAGDKPVIAALAPSFPAAYDRCSPGQLVTAVRQLGFAEVLEVAFGAELVSRRYSELAKEGRDQPIITTPCPAVVTLVEKFYPGLLPYLAPVVSPAIALARVVKQQYRPEARVVFIGPCIAKKAEIEQPSLVGDVDAVLTFRGLRQLLDSAGIQPHSLTESECDGPKPSIARIFPLQGGLLRAAAMKADLLETDVVVLEGKEIVLHVLREMDEGKLTVRFLDILFCDGCIDGPVMETERGLLTRKESVARYVKSRMGETSQEELEHTLMSYSHVDLSRTFEKISVAPPECTEEDVVRILRQTNKFSREDELNCGACGYGTCREKAVAVHQGLAELEMCLPYLLDRFQWELRATKDQLVQSEKLASIGQLAAGVAHEINNPLGTIMIYAHMLMKGLSQADQQWEDLRLIVDEAGRCRTIVAGLLEFARQGKLETEQTDVNCLLEDILAQLNRQPSFRNVSIVQRLNPDLPEITADPTQLRQVFTNIIVNAAEAMPEGGDLEVATGITDMGRSIWISTSDTGSGISEENLKKLFMPFFTTKMPGKGTGLGLAIAYGIVKMHRGRLDVHSKVDAGSTFTVTLPVDGPHALPNGTGRREGGLIGETE